MPSEPRKGRSRYIIVGAGGHAREVLDVFQASTDSTEQCGLAGFLDDDPGIWGRVVNSYPVLGGVTWLRNNEPTAFTGFCGVGKPLARMQAVRRYEEAGLTFGGLTHQRATLTKLVSVGEGVILTAGSVLTNRVILGRHVHINLNATISHDCVVGDFCTVAPGANISGNVRLGTGVEVGVGAAITQGVTVGDWAVIGAGAVVINDIPAGATAVGVPARVIKVSTLPGVRGECTK